MFLHNIVEAKKDQLSRLKQARPLAELRDRIGDLPPARNFRRALQSRECAVIAEIKRKSPSRGRLREDFDPAGIASIYEANGAAAISVLTERRFFEGDDRYLKDVRDSVGLPILRKDFILDEYQIYETRALLGDALLLIEGLLEDGQMRDYIAASEELGLSALVEVHSLPGLERALGAGAKIVGINNRNLETFETDLAISLDLAPRVPGHVTLVSESGIQTRTDVVCLMRAGISAFLVGETLMRAGDIGRELRGLLGEK